MASADAGLDTAPRTAVLAADRDVRGAVEHQVRVTGKFVKNFGADERAFVLVEDRTCAEASAERRDVVVAVADTDNVEVVDVGIDVGQTGKAFEGKALGRRAIAYLAIDAERIAVGLHTTLVECAAVKIDAVAVILDQRIAVETDGPAHQSVKADVPTVGLR